MQTYSEFRPTAFDSRGLGLSDQQNWLLAPCGVNRDSDALTRSNFRCCLAALGGESETVEIHRFGHWGAGWFEVILIDPVDAARVKVAEGIEASLADYPVLDEQDFGEEETQEANEVWARCYRAKERIAYIRRYRSQFDFSDFADLHQD